MSVMLCPMATFVIGLNMRTGATDAPVMVDAMSMETKSICPNIAGKLPVLDASRMRAPSLVVIEANVAVAACELAGRVTCPKLNATVVSAVKLPPAVRANKIFSTFPVMEGLHVAPVPGVVTEHLGLTPMKKEPESVMMMAELPEETMATEGMNVTKTELEQPCN